MNQYYPHIVVWELTNECNAKCLHCGSKSGKKRRHELTEDEALKLCDDLHELGCKDVTLMGGEFFLKAYWHKVAQKLHNYGMRVALLTNGILLDDKNIQKILDTGIPYVFLSIDGIGKTHDRIRGVPGLYKNIMANIENAKKQGLKIGAVSAFSAINLSEITNLHQLLKKNGVKMWQIQIVEDIGHASKNSQLSLSTENLYDLAKKIATIRKNEKEIKIVLCDNIGFFSSFEPLIRDTPFRGCMAGRYVLGIESNGNIRGCLSIPRNSKTTEGNIRERPLSEIWNDPYLFDSYRKRTVGKLKGFCAECEYGKICLAGCSSLAYSLTGDFYENPFCLHRHEKENDIV